MTFPRPSTGTRVAALAGLLWLLIRPAVPAGDSPLGPPTVPRRLGPDPDLAAAGRHVFAEHCQTCHGRRGNGRGELARGMVPKPRDFTLGLFKFRSTPSGTPPTDEDLVRTIRGGLEGAAMPAFTILPERDLRAVIEHLKTLSPRWTNSSVPPVPIPVPPVPEWMDQPLERARHAASGRSSFERLCSPCHGADGSGDGPSAAGLRDARGDPCPPRNLRRHPFRRGTDPKALYRTLVTGLDGTPMPSIEATLTGEDRWDLVAFVLAERDSPKPPSPPPNSSR